MIHSEVGSKKLATIGVEDLIVVDSGDALLIAKKGSSQRVKEVVELLSDELKNGQLQSLLTDFQLPPLPVHIVHREGINASAKVRSFIDLLTEKIQQRSM